MVGRKPWFGMALCVLASFSGEPSIADQSNFPFGKELLLDVDPMPGSKRVPTMDIAANGAIMVEMWCNRIEGQLVVAGDTITVLTGQATERQCQPERLRGDAGLLSALVEVTSWRREGDFVELTGRRTLRFRLQTN